MPIRMEEDQNYKDKQNSGPEFPNQPQNNKGGTGIAGLLPLALTFLFRNPKLLIVVAIAGAAWYFLGGGQSMLNNNVVAEAESSNPDYTTGMEMDQAKFDKTEVYTPLAEGFGNTLPSSVSLLQYAPKRLHQGHQGSCVGWASSYGARTILHSRATGSNPNNVAFSPSFLYNQIALSGCEGAYMEDAMKVLHQRGDLPLREFGYDENSCGVRPDQDHLNRASDFKIKGYNRLTLNHDQYTPDVLAMKENLAQGAPVVIGMMVGGSFMQDMAGREVWIPTRADYNQRGFGGHAMCIIGYDDYKEGGSFQIMNSWGEEWGDNGIAWVRYKDVEYFTKEVYGLYPMGDASKFDQNKLAARFGLVDISAGNYIPLREISDKVFRTSTPIRTGDKFKIAFTNSIECYTYVFGQESDGSSYVLFPYTQKHSPYCGITGTRVFPKDYNMVADNVGQLDRIAILVTKEPVDYQALSAAISASPQSAFAAKWQAIIGADVATDIRYEDGETIGFECDLNGKAGAYVIVELDKQ